MTEEKSIALGTFDGLHLGHQSVIELAEKSDYAPYILLFSEHPLKSIKGVAPPELLTDTVKDRLLLKFGVEKIVLDFNDIMNMPPEDFFYKILLKQFNAKELSCGENYTFGRNGDGNADLLLRLCLKNSVKLNIAKMQMLDGKLISSTAIRTSIQNGDLETANKMLARPFSYDFKVVSGDRRGRLLGFPTINQFFPDGFIEPRHGVYASTVTLNKKSYAAVTNFGLRPTIGTKSLRSETCILGFSGDLYGKYVEVGLLSYMRPEIKFNNLNELSAQISEDAKTSQKIFQNSIANCTQKR